MCVVKKLKNRAVKNMLLKNILLKHRKVSLSGKIVNTNRQKIIIFVKNQRRKSDRIYDCWR